MVCILILKLNLRKWRRIIRLNIFSLILLSIWRKCVYLWLRFLYFKLELTAILLFNIKVINMIIIAQIKNLILLIINYLFDWIRIQIWRIAVLCIKLLVLVRYDIIRSWNVWQNGIRILVFISSYQWIVIDIWSSSSLLA